MGILKKTSKRGLGSVAPIKLRQPPVFILYCVLSLNLCYCGVSIAGDDPETVAIIAKHVRFIERNRADEMGDKRITGIYIASVDAAADIYPRLPKLEYLEKLELSGEWLTDRELQTIPPLPNLKVLELERSGVTDEGLKHLSGMTGLTELHLRHTKIVGPGLAYLKGFDQLKLLDVSDTPLDDRAMPHVAANFPRLSRLSLGGTKITPAGLMQLVDLHWLEYVATPNGLVGPDHSQAKTYDERAKLIQEQDKAKLAVFEEFAKRHMASKLKAREAGVEVPRLLASPFSNYVANVEGLPLDDPATVELIRKHLRPGSFRYDFDRRIFTMALKFTAQNRAGLIALLPRLKDLENLRFMGIRGDAFEESDLKLLPSLPNLENFSVGPISDAGLEHLAGMKGLKSLKLKGADVRGSGLAHLKGLGRLEKLEIDSPALGDSAVPHIVANFPKLQHLNVGTTKVSREGILQLAELHGLHSIIVPAAIATPELTREFQQRQTASKQKARAAGIEMPPYDRQPTLSPGWQLPNPVVPPTQATPKP